MSDIPKASIKELKEFFEKDGRPVGNRELLDFKKFDPDGYDQVAIGIGNGSLTY